jgi:hypothetical protein
LVRQQPPAERDIDGWANEQIAVAGVTSVAFTLSE